MISLSERITADMKEAMKTKNNATLSTLRLLRSALKNKQIDVQHELNDTEVQDVVKSQVKQLKDSIIAFEQGGRPEMASSAQVEVDVLQAYLPKQLDDAALEAIVKEAVTASGAQGKQDTGKAMGAAMKAVAGQADGTRVKELVERLLSVCAIIFIGMSVGIPVEAASELFADTSLTSGLDLGLRLIRVSLLWIGVFAVNNILNGGFSYMVAGNRDDGHEKAFGKIMSGFVGSIVVVIAFAIVTVYIDIL